MTQHPRVRARRGSRCRGLALIAVLWIVALLTVLATAAVTLSLTHRRTTETYLESVHADNDADSAIRLALLTLLAPPGRGSTWPLGQPQALTVLGTPVEVTVEREAGRIDLNTADPELLFALFAANGWSEPQARSMVARITDWKDADDDVSPGGAEMHEYRAAGLSYGPHNAPFESVEELHQVLGSERIQAELLGSLTVFTHSPGSSDSVATPAVRRALTWADEHQLGAHRWLTSPSSPIASTFGPADTSVSGEVLRARACLKIRHLRRCRVAVVRLTGNLIKPLQIFQWQTLQE